jgi:hypothetical protein
MSNIQNTFGTINAKKRTSPNPELDEESADNGFAGLIEDEVYLPEEVYFYQVPFISLIFRTITTANY